LSGEVDDAEAEAGGGWTEGTEGTEGMEGTGGTEGVGWGWGCKVSGIGGIFGNTVAAEVEVEVEGFEGG
jgi:hypothetical protein